MNFEDFKTLLPHKKVFKKFLLPENLPHPDTLESKMVKEDQTLDHPPYIVKVDKKYVKYGGIWVSYDSMLLDQFAIKKAKDSGVKWPQYQGVPFTDNELAELLYNDNTVVLARNTNQQLQLKKGRIWYSTISDNQGGDVIRPKGHCGRPAGMEPE